MRRIPLVVLGPRPARVGYAFLLWAVVLVTVGQWLLVAVPSVPMPLALTEAFKPVWPNTAPALLAVVLFLVSLTLFVLGLRRLLPEPVVRAADWPTPNWGTWQRSDAGLVGLGTGLTLVLVLLLAATPYATWYPAWFGLGVLLIVIGLARREQTGRELAHLKTLLRPRPLLECLAVILAIAAFGWVATFDLDRWYYSSIGDEHPFFELAREFALGGGAVRNLFS